MARWVVLALLVTACGGSGSLSGAFDQRIPVQPGGLLQVDLDLGEETRSERVTLEVRSHDADEVWTVADVSGPGAAGVQFRLSHDATGVRLYGHAGGLLSWLFGGPSVAVRVFVPREFSLDLRSASGPIRVEDVIGDLRARSLTGRIEVRGVEGRVRLRSSGGDVAVTEVQGPVDVRAQSGAIELAWITGEVAARTGEGDVRARHVDGKCELRADSGELELVDLRGPVSAKTEYGAVSASFVAEPSGVLETQRGSVEVRLPAQARLALEARSGRGAVEVDSGLLLAGAREPDRVAGTLNGGGEPLRVYTAHGSVHVGAR